MNKLIWMATVVLGLASTTSATTIYSATTANSTFVHNEVQGTPATGSLADGPSGIIVTNHGVNFGMVGFTSTDTINTLNGTALTVSNTVTLKITVDDLDGTIRANGINFGMAANAAFLSGSSSLVVGAEADNNGNDILIVSSFQDSGDTGFDVTNAELYNGFTMTLTADVEGYTFVLDSVGNTDPVTVSGTFAGNEFLDYFSTGHFYYTAQQFNTGLPLVSTISEATISVDTVIVPVTFFEATTNNTTLFSNGVADTGLMTLSGATPDLILTNNNGSFNNGGFGSTENMSSLLGTSLHSSNEVTIRVTVDSIGGVGELRSNGFSFGMGGAPVFYGGGTHSLFMAIAADNSGAGVSLYSTFLTGGATGLAVSQSSLEDGFGITLTANSRGYRFELTDIVVNGSGATTAEVQGSFFGTEFVDHFNQGHFYLSAQKWNTGNVVLDVSEASMAVVEIFVPTPYEGDWLVWSGADGNSLYEDGNWIDPDTGAAPDGCIIPDVAGITDLDIRTGTPGGSEGASGSLWMGSGRLSISGATLRMAKESGVDLGGLNKELTMIDGKLFADSLNNATCTMQGRSELTLYSATPLFGTTIDLQSEDCFVFFLGKLPTEIISTYLANFTVNGAAATTSNVDIRQYYTGAVITPKTSVPMRGFAEPGLQGEKWNFSTGFFGQIGIGDAVVTGVGNYTLTGYGTDIGSTADQCHYVYRPITNDFEMVSKIAWVEKTHANAKSGIMIRETLANNSRHATIYSQNDKQVNFLSRWTTGGSTQSAGLTGGTAAKFIRLTRTGETFVSYYSTSSATGPWTEVGRRTIPMTDAVYVGFAVASKNKGEPCVSTVQSTAIYQDSVALGDRVIGQFDAHKGIYNFPQEDQMRSFLLKKGYMVTLAEEGGGQGFSKVYVATDADLVVDLPAELDGKVSFMRILPWRWIAKKGWGGHNNTHMTNLGVYWSYEWEPTGNSTTDREFVPMIKGAGQNKDSRWEEVRVRGNQTHFLVFNEPMQKDQGDLTVAEAIALYPKALQLGLRLGSPARTDGSNGDNWLKSFMTQADALGYRVDFVCVHNYNRTSANALKTWLNAEYAKYQRPIWLTEFNRDNDGNTTVEQHEAYLAGVIPMLESLHYIERYAYYNFGGNNMSLVGNNGSANTKGVIYRDTPSTPAYVEDQPVDWATASLDLPNSQSVMFQGQGTTIVATPSLDPSVISSVEFFVDNVSVGTDASSPFELSADDVSEGLHAVHAVFTTTFGERIVSTSSQLFSSRLELSSTSSAPDGELVWSAVPGETYRVEWSSSLTNTMWNLMEERTATGYSEQAQDPSPSSDPSRFYRVKWSD